MDPQGRLAVEQPPAPRALGLDVPVNARVEVINSMSAHGDSQEVLRWLRGFKAPPKQTFLVHGEPSAMDALQQKIAKELGWKTHMPQWQERVDLE